jgi:hypothetical protein
VLIKLEMAPNPKSQPQSKKGESGKGQSQNPKIS